MKDLTAVREHGEWEASRGQKERRGKRHFKGCETVCPFFETFNKLPPHIGKPGLDAECARCEWPDGPGPEVEAVAALAMMPDGAIDYRGYPAWVTVGVGFYRAMNRGGF